LNLAILAPARWIIRSIARQDLRALRRPRANRPHTKTIPSTKKPGRSRNMRTPLLGGTMVALIALAGCGTPPRDQGFSDVALLVQDRTGQAVHWRRGTADDTQVTTAVHDLLSRPLTPDSAIQVALLNNPRLHATYQELGISQAELVQAGLLRNPTLVAGVKFFSDGPLIELSLVENLLQVFTLPARTRFAEAQLAQAKATVAGVIIDLMADTRRAALTMLAAQQMLEMRRTILDSLDAAAELSTRIHAAGNSTTLEYTTDVAAAAQARLDVSTSEDALLIARERLTVAMGLWGMDATRWTMTGRLPDLPTADGTGDGTGLERRAITVSLDLMAMREGARALGERYGIERLDAWFGDLAVGVAGERESSGDWGFGPEVGLALPIFDQGQGRRAAVSAQVELLARLYHARAIELRSQVRVARAQVRSAYARARFLREVLLPLRTRIISESMLHYNGMLIGPFQALEAKRMEIEAGGQYIEALKQFWLERTTLDQALQGRAVHPSRSIAGETP